jgi:hypothetical protein
LELLRKVQNGGDQAFGNFYNALILSFNTNAAALLLPAINSADIVEVGDEKFYRTIR